MTHLRQGLTKLSRLASILKFPNFSLPSTGSVCSPCYRLSLPLNAERNNGSARGSTTVNLKIIAWVNT